ncbi:alpha/beta fold hydrolase [Streptomyces sp. NPDC020379]|uniref:alpha/beta fold hydrolase n=1 Tax=Streptomyces sp. NPDC020379 TaxID=3365071 RepID=UPI00379AE840
MEHKPGCGTTRRWGCPPPTPGSSGKVTAVDDGDPQYVRLSYGRCCYRRWGPRGKAAILLLHATADSSAGWSRVARALAARHTVYAPDLRGHGMSARPAPGRYRIGTVADDVRAFIDAVGLFTPVVVGHSWGAAIALTLAGGRHPPPLRGLVLEELPARISPETHPEHVRSLQAAAALDHDDVRELVALRHPQWHPDDVRSLADGLDMADAQTVHSVVADGAHAGCLPPLLQHLTVPCLLLRADPTLGTALDDTAWEEARRRLSAGGAALRIPGASHDIHRSRFEEFVRVVEEFIASL